MTTLPPILNAPQVGMLISALYTDTSEDESLLIVWVDIDARRVGVIPSDGSISGGAMITDIHPRDRIRWPNAPEDSWVSVFAEKVEPVREWTKFVQKELAPDFLTNLNWVSSQAEAEAQEVPPGYIRLAIACRERQPDGTWRAVSDRQDIHVQDGRGHCSLTHHQSRYAGLWEQHPEAVWISTDGDGAVRWWTCDPRPAVIGPWWTASGDNGFITWSPAPYLDWRDSLERRPEGV